MTFLYPYNLLWVLLAIPLLLLYVAPAFSRSWKVSSLPLWKAALAQRSPWRQWQWVVSLAMHMATLVLLVIAAAYPTLSPPGSGRRMVIVVDATASMSANTGGVTPFAEARRDARRLLNRLGQHDQAAILSVQGEVIIHSRMSDNTAALHAAVDGISATAEPGDLNQALQTARAMTKGRDNAEIIVLTDHAGAASLKAGDKTKVIITGKPAPNLAITRFTARPVLTADNTYDVTVEVSNFTGKPGDIELSVGMLNQMPERIILKAPPGSAVSHSLLITPEMDGWLQAEIKTTAENDALAADNRAWLPLQPRSRKKVALVTSGNRQLEAAFTALPRYETTVYADAAAAPPTAEVTVFDRATPPSLPAGPVIVFFPNAACNLWQTPTVVTRSRAAWQQSPELAQGVEISRISLEDVAKMQFEVKAETLAASPDGTPLISRIDRREGPVYVVHIDLRQSDWALRPQFAVFASNLLQQTAPQREAIQTPVTTANRHRLPAASQSRQFTPPSGAATMLPAGVPPRFTQTGFWKIDDRAVAVNLLAPAESNLQPAAERDSAEVDAVPVTTDGIPLWLGFVIAAVAVAVYEWWLFQRRVTV